METIKIDGDYYRMRLPTPEEWKALTTKYIFQPAGVLVPLQFSFPEKTPSAWVNIYDHETARKLAAFSSEVTIHDYLFRIDGDGAAIRGPMGKKSPIPGVRKIAFMPCLVPLGRDMQPISELFKKDNPDGTKIHGGTCAGIGFKDSEPNIYNMLWIAMNGNLFCGKPEIQVDLGEMMEYGPDLYFDREAAV